MMNVCKCTAKFLALLPLILVGQISFGSELAISKVFVPSAFDSNDVIEITYEGMLLNCAQLGRNRAIVNQETRTVVIRQDTTHHSDCLFPVRPFHNTVKFAEALAPGAYQVSVEGSEEKFSLNVGAAKTTNIDENNYAPIDTVHISRTPNGQRSLIIRGRFPHGCVQFKEDISIKRADDVLELLPVVESTSGRNCNDNEAAFEKEFLIPSDLLKGKYLVHVRSDSGKSFNLLHVVFADGDPL